MWRPFYHALNPTTMSVSLDQPPPDHPMDVDGLPSEDQQLASASADASDPSSLRAAALLTLRSKRRSKPSSSELSGQPSSMPSRLDNAVPSSVQLDYGNEDNSAKVSATRGSSSTKTKSAQPEHEDGQTREEGEISDSETPSPAPASQSASPSLTKPAQQSPSQPASQTTPVISPAQPTTHLLRSPTSPTTATQPQKSLPEKAVVDAAHIRPGVAREFRLSVFER